MIDEESNIEQQFFAARAYQRHEEARNTAAVLANQRIMMNHGELYAATRPAYEQIFGDSRQALGNGHGEMAVVLAPQTAAELCTELVIADLLQHRDLGELAEPLLGLVTVKDICRDQLRAVYNALAHDEIERADFWPYLKECRTLRNRIVHKGAKCSPEEARESLDAVEQFIKHVEGVMGLEKLQGVLASIHEEIPST